MWSKSKSYFLKVLYFTAAMERSSSKRSQPSDRSTHCLYVCALEMVNGRLGLALSSMKGRLHYQVCAVTGGSLWHCQVMSPTWINATTAADQQQKCCARGKSTRELQSGGSALCHLSRSISLQCERLLCIDSGTYFSAALGLNFSPPTVLSLCFLNPSILT